MNYPMKYLLSLTLLLLLTACGSSRTSTAYKTVDDGYGPVAKHNNTGSISEVENPDVARPLDIHLSTLPGVSVNGSGPNAQVRVRGGNNSFVADPEPLFVLNGQQLSGGFSALYSSVAVADIANISVLKGSSASMYGTRGANGVIVVRTK